MSGTWNTSYCASHPLDVGTAHKHTTTTFPPSRVCPYIRRAGRNRTLDCTPYSVVFDQLFPQFCEEDPAFVQDAVHPVWIKMNPYNECVQRTHIKQIAKKPSAICGCLCTFWPSGPLCPVRLSTHYNQESFWVWLSLGCQLMQCHAQ